MEPFTVIDLETANPDYSSICQIGVVDFNNGKVERRWSSLVDPETVFDPHNIAIHGISEGDVAGAPTLAEIFPEVSAGLSERLALHHGFFDRVAMQRSYERHELASINCKWLDNTKVVRRVWEEFSRKGYNLANLSKHFGIFLDHHDALSDAEAAGLIFLKALQDSGTNASDWFELANRPISAASATPFEGSGNPEGDFYGETLVFTGALSIPRREAAQIAKELGFEVAKGVTKKTSFVCIGEFDPSTLRGNEKSNKQEKAEQLILSGQDISILTEIDFLALRKRGFS